MKKLFAAIGLGLLSIGAQAQDSTSTSGKHLFGLHAGSSTGVGFSYRYVQHKYGIQITGIPVFRGSEAWTSAGIAATYRVAKEEDDDDKLDFLIYAGGHYLWQKQDNYVWDDINNTGNYESQISSSVTVSLGIGLETQLSNRLVLTTMAGYGLYLNNNVNTNIAGEIGLHYQL